MELTSANLRAAREAVQPSLWDRLINDLPGISSEIAALRREAEAALGAERVAALLDGAPRSIDGDADLLPEQKKLLHRLAFLARRQVELESHHIVVSASVLREAVRRDIEALFNTERFECVPMLGDHEAELLGETVFSLDDFPAVKRSVVNFGVPSFSGRSARDFDADQLAREIREIVATFEPRLKRDTIRVRVHTSDKTGLRISMEATLMLSPVPERLRLSTTVDLDNGQAVTAIEEA